MRIMTKILSFVFCLSITFCMSSRSSAQVITTLAGNGTAAFGGDAGASTAAQVNYPFGVAVDTTTGNIYIADTKNNRIREIVAATGIINTIAGTGVAGALGDGGAATAAQLNNPTAVAIDLAHNVYIADQANNRVRMIVAATGNITTLAGTGIAGYFGDRGAATAAELNSPYGVATDAAGNVYIADALNNRIRLVTVTTGVITSIAGTGVAAFGGDGGVATGARLNTPEGVYVDATGSVYIADTYNDRIRKITGTGPGATINTIAGNGTTGYVAGAATATGLNLPTGITMDRAGNYYIADANNNQVEMVTTGTSIISVLAGTGVAGYNGDCLVPNTAQLNNPTGIAVDISGNYFIADSGNNRIREITQPCSGTPAATAVTANVSAGCTAYSSTLTATGAALGCGISYQWQSSPDGITFTPIAGATDAVYVANVTVSTFYNFLVTCSYSGNTSTSNTVALSLSNASAVGAITGGFSPICVGITLNLTDTTAGGTWSVTNANATVTFLGFVTGITPGVDTVLYSVTEACGVVTDSFVITIDTTYTPSVILTSFPGATVCHGDSVRINATPVYGGTAPAYQWTINGINYSTSDTITFMSANGQVVVCTMTSNEFCASPTTGTATVTIVVDSFIKPGISINDGLYGDSVCAGVPINFFAVDTNGGAIPVNTWYVNGGIVGTGATLAYTPANGDIVQCRLISSFICAVPDTVYSKTKDMSVYTVQNPNLTIFENYGDTSCAGYNAVFTAHPIFGGITPFLRWSVNRVNVATGPTYSYLPHTGDSVYCMMASSSTCRSVDTVFSNAIRTTVSPLVYPTVTINAHPGLSIVVGQYDTLTATSTNGGTAPTYQWFVNGNLIAGVTGSTYITDSLTNNVLVSCIITSNFPCADPPTGVSNSVTVAVNRVGVAEVNASTIYAAIIPNPNKGTFMIDGNIGSNGAATIEITNVLGQVVLKQVINANNGNIKKEISINSEFADGIYLLHIITGIETKVMRFSVNR